MKQKQRGYITVEAALVMPVILGVILLFYTVAMIQYESVTARTAAIREANRKAINWNITGGDTHNILKETESGANAITSESFKEHDPYRFFSDMFSGRASGFFNRYVEVKMEYAFSNPMLELLNRMGFSISGDDTVTAKARVTDPAEFVRNISFLQELMGKLFKNKEK